MCESSLAAVTVFFVLFLSPCTSKQWSVAGLSFRDHFSNPFLRAAELKGMEVKVKKKSLVEPQGDFAAC